MSTLLDSTSYDAIRAALGVTSAMLGDATIEVFLASADREVKRLVSNWATLTGDNLAALEQSAIYLTAERIALATPKTSKVSGLGYSLEQSGITGASLRELAYLELLGLGITLSSNYGFSVRTTRADGYTEVEEAL